MTLSDKSKLTLYDASVTLSNGLPSLKKNWGIFPKSISFVVDFLINVDWVRFLACCDYCEEGFLN